MASYAVFFAEQVGAGIEMVQAMDRGHAEDIARTTYPDAHLSGIEAEQLEGVNRMQMLLAWLETLDAGTSQGAEGKPPTGWRCPGSEIPRDRHASCPRMPCRRGVRLRFTRRCSCRGARC